MGVGLVLDDEHDVGGYGAGRLVALAGERDLGALLPAPLDLDGEDLVLVAQRAPVGVQPLAGDLHALGAAVEHLLQGDPQLVVDGRVLLTPLCPTPPLLLLLLLAPHAHVALTREAVDVEAGEGAEGVAAVHLHVVVVAAEAAAAAAAAPVGLAPEEHLEGAGAAEEGVEGGVRVPVEGVGEVAALAVGGGAVASLET